MLFSVSEREGSGLALGAGETASKRPHRKGQVGWWSALLSSLLLLKRQQGKKERTLTASSVLSVTEGEPPHERLRWKPWLTE